ncbi:hypothetical protein KKG22_03495 [Patescibacteria group bacterium]|nr:hypothetical protein [Patescibacteria group bacterium]MBU1721214.1 hypothetical protein [Patescibacteria group bacterium]MBU1901078.1 hypothetical protein [Patescibacteria group bacterium]
MFIIIDGIDGSGKSTVLDTWGNTLESLGKKVFHLKKYWQEHKAHPTATELMDYDVIMSAEPTHAWIGKAIREEMIQDGNDYNMHDIASAYALDRLVLYKRLILPLRKAGKLIIQDRSVSTSLCYQPLASDNITMEEIAKIPGNAFALKHPPDHFVIANVSPEEAMKRLSLRTEKEDNAIFEKEQFLKKAQARFLDKTYQTYFKKHGTHIHLLDCNQKIAIMKETSITLLNHLLLL